MEVELKGNESFLMAIRETQMQLTVCYVYSDITEFVINMCGSWYIFIPVKLNLEIFRFDCFTWQIDWTLLFSFSSSNEVVRPVCALMAPIVRVLLRFLRLKGKQGQLKKREKLEGSF